MAKDTFDAIQSGQYKSNGNYRKKKKYETDFDAIQDGSYIYNPEVQKSKKSNVEENNGFFDNWFKAGAFSDGYQFGDVSKTILGSAADVGLGVVEGIMSGGEGIGDWLSYRTADVLDLFGGEDAARSVRENANINATNELFNVIKKKGNIEDNSVFGTKADSISNAMGTILTMTSTAGLGGAAGLGKVGQTALSMGTMGIGSAGSGESEALQSGATPDEARLYGTISGAGEVFSEMLFGGLGKGAKAIGISKGLSSADDMLAKAVSDKFKSRLAKNLTQYGIKAGAEGLEEVISGIIQATGKKLTYMSEEEIGKLLQNEELLDQFIVGAISSGISQTPGLVKTTAKGQDFLTGYTKNEQKVYDRLINDETKKALEKNDGKKLTKKQINQIEENVREEMSKGRVNVDYIEDTLGFGDRVNYLVNEAENMQAKKLTPEERIDIENQVRQEILGTMGNDYILQESYLQDQLRHTRFNVDLNSVDDSMKEYYKTTMEEGQASDSRDSHNIVDFGAKLYRDTGIMTHFVSDETARESLLNKVISDYMTKNGLTQLTDQQREQISKKFLDSFDKYSVNGYEINGELYINTGSQKALESIIGHELTHTLEKSGDMYDQLRKSLLEYAKTNKEASKRLDEIQKTPYYDSLNKEQQMREYTADLVGDYLFTNQEFINHLTQNRNLFQKIYDEIKYLVKQVTAGSKEERKLNKAMKMFEKAYKEMSVKLAEQENDGNYKFALAYVDKARLSTNERARLNEAIDLKNKGYTDEQIWQQTQVIMGDTIADSKVDIPDLEFKDRETVKKILKMDTDVRLADVMEGDMFKNYPQFKNYEIRVFDFEKQAIKEKLSPKEVKQYKGTKGAVTTDGKIVINSTIKTLDEVEGIISHEVQHLIQEASGKEDNTAEILEKEGVKAYKLNPNELEAETTRVMRELTQRQRKLINPQSVEEEIKKYYEEHNYGQLNVDTVVNRLLNKHGLQFSLSQDSKGNELSKEQQEYFKDSKVRDDEGRLQPVYHMTNADFNKIDFDKNYQGIFWFASSKQDLQDGIVSAVGTRDKANSKIMELYANITNPAGWREYDNYGIGQLKEMGYDGVILKEDDGSFVGFVFNDSNQIKNVDNLNPTSNPDIRYSLTQDNTGRKLTNYALEKTKNSKVRDENGNLMLMYHGSPNGEYGQLRAGTYFTSNKEYADGYQNTWASSLANSGKESVNPKTYEAYLNIENPFTLQNDEAKNIYLNEYIKGGNSLYFDPYTDYTDTINNLDEIDWTEGEDLKEWLMENHPEYDGLVLDEGGDGGYGEAEYRWRGKSYIPFSEEQIIPANENNTKYSLTKKVDAELDDLTDAQYEYFKNTKAVDNDGELEVVYHGTPNQFNVFDITKAGTTGVSFGNGFYFTNSRGTARAFTGSNEGLYSTNDDNILEGYINIEKPAISDAKTMTFEEFNNLYNALNENPNMYDEEMGMSNIDALLSDYGNIYDDKQNVIRQFYDSYDDDVSLIDNLSYISNPTEMYKTLRDVTGYDGIIIENPSGYDAYEKYYVVFNPDQFKLKSNKTPTDNVDMNLSLSRIDEIAPTRQPGLTYGEDVAYQEEIAPDGLDYSIKKDIMDLIHQEIARKNGKKTQLSTPVIAKEKSDFAKATETLATAFVNKNAVVDKLAKDSGNKNIKIMADMLNNYSAEALNDIVNAQTDNYGNAIGKAVQQLFEEVKAKGLEAQFNDYLINYSNIDRWARGKGSQTPLDVSERLVKDYEEKYPLFKKWAKDVWKYSANVRDNWLEAGLVTKKMHDILANAYPHYVPYISDGNNFDATLDRLNELKARPIKKAVGGATELFPVEEALTRYTYSQKRAVRQNDLYREIYNTLADHVGQRGVEVGEDFLNGTERNLYRADDGNYLTAVENGEARSVQITDDLFKALNNDMENQIRDLEQRLSLITKPLQTASNIRRQMLTNWSPSFMITNPLKDIQDALFNSKHLGQMVKNYLPGIKELWTASTPQARQFMALYGEGNLMGQFANESGLYDTKKGAKNGKFLKGLSKVNNIMELAPRYAEFKASLQAGESLQEAMYNAREVTTNFSRGGVITKALNRNGFTFLNASVQGFDKFIRNFSGENGARGIANSLLKAVMLGVVPAVFNELAFGGGDDKDEDYDALPDYIKDNYYLIKTGDGTFVRIPKGRMLSVFGSAARRTIELAEGEENAFEGYLSNVNNQIGINNPEENNIFSPFVQAYGSKNGTAWYGGDIVPSRLQDKPKNEQYDASTDKFSIWLSNTALGKKMGLSPYKVNYVLDQYTGGIGDIVLPMITDEATSNGSLLAPVTDKFTADSTTDNKYVSDFYTKNDELKVKANSSEATDDDYLRNQYMYNISKEMGKLYAERRKIQADNSLSKSEKYEKSQAIKDQINKFAKYGLDSYDNISRTGNYAQVGDDMGYYKNAKGNWTPIDQKDIIATESIGLTDREKSTYYGVKNDMYNIDQKYEPKLKTASDEEKTVLNAQKKVDIINSIKETNLPDEAKAVLYDKKYASTETLNAVLNCGIDFDSYLDLESQNFTADKNIYGKTINGSKKSKVYSYINNLNMDYEHKIMLAKLEYKSDNTYNNEIIQILNNDPSISYYDMKEILEAMGMKVDSYGNVTW